MNWYRSLGRVLVPTDANIAPYSALQLTIVNYRQSIGGVGPRPQGQSLRSGRIVVEYLGGRYVIPIYTLVAVIYLLVNVSLSKIARRVSRWQVAILIPRRGFPIRKQYSVIGVGTAAGGRPSHRPCRGELLGGRSFDHRRVTRARSDIPDRRRPPRERMMMLPGSCRSTCSEYPEG